MIYLRDWRNTKETESVNVGDKLGRGVRPKEKKIKDYSGILARAVGETLSDVETLTGRKKSLEEQAGVGRTGDRG